MACIAKEVGVWVPPYMLCRTVRQCVRCVRAVNLQLNLPSRSLHLVPVVSGPISGNSLNRRIPRRAQPYDQIHSLDRPTRNENRFPDLQNNSPRNLVIGAAQLEPIARTETRESVVRCMLALMETTSARNCSLIVFPELASTSFSALVHDRPI